MSCFACGDPHTTAQVIDRAMDHCYDLCNKCLYGEWPPWEERKKKLLAELDKNIPTPEGETSAGQ